MSSDSNTLIENKARKYTDIILDLISPSVFGVIFYLTIFLITIFIEQNNQFLGFIKNNNLTELKTTIFGQYINDLINVLNLPFANTLTISIFWLVAATFIYYIGYKIYKGEHELTTDIKLRGYIRPEGTNRNLPLLDFFKKILLRIFVLVFFIIFLKQIIPMLIKFLKINNLNFSFSLNFLESSLKVLIAELLMLHFLVIFIRLILLKRRIFFNEKY